MLFYLVLEISEWERLYNVFAPLNAFKVFFAFTYSLINIQRRRILYCFSVLWHLTQQNATAFTQLLYTNFYVHLMMSVRIVYKHIWNNSFKKTASIYVRMIRISDNRRRFCLWQLADRNCIELRLDVIIEVRIERFYRIIYISVAGDAQRMFNIYSLWAVQQRLREAIEILSANLT